MCECPANEMSAPLRSEEVHAMREVVNSMQGTGSDKPTAATEIKMMSWYWPVYPTTAYLAYLLHFDNLWYINIIHILLLTWTCALFEHLVLSLYSFVQSGHFSGIVRSKLSPTSSLQVLWIWWETKLRLWSYLDILGWAVLEELFFLGGQTTSAQTFLTSHAGKSWPKLTSCRTV